APGVLRRTRLDHGGLLDRFASGGAELFVGADERVAVRQLAYGPSGRLDRGGDGVVHAGGDVAGAAGFVLERGGFDDAAGADPGQHRAGGGLDVRLGCFVGRAEHGAGRVVVCPGVPHAQRTAFVGAWDTWDTPSGAYGPVQRF